MVDPPDPGCCIPNHSLCSRLLHLHTRHIGAAPPRSAQARCNIAQSCRPVETCVRTDLIIAVARRLCRESTKGSPSRRALVVGWNTRNGTAGTNGTVGGTAGTLFGTLGTGKGRASARSGREVEKGFDVPAGGGGTTWEPQRHEGTKGEERGIRGRTRVDSAVEIWTQRARAGRTAVRPYERRRPGGRSGVCPTGKGRRAGDQRALQEAATPPSQVENLCHQELQGEPRREAGVAPGRGLPQRRAQACPPYRTANGRRGSVTPPYRTADGRRAWVRPPYRTADGRRGSVTPPYRTADGRRGSVTPPYRTDQRPAVARDRRVLDFCLAAG